MRVTIDEIKTESEFMFLDGIEEEKNVILIINYTVSFESSHKLNGELALPSSEHRNDSFADLEKGIKQMLINEVEYAKGV